MREDGEKNLASTAIAGRPSEFKAHCPLMPQQQAMTAAAEVLLEQVIRIPKIASPTTSEMTIVFYE